MGTSWDTLALWLRRGAVAGPDHRIVPLRHQVQAGGSMSDHRPAMVPVPARRISLNSWALGFDGKSVSTSPENDLKAPGRHIDRTRMEICQCARAAASPTRYAPSPSNA